MIASLSIAAGQEDVKIELHSLYWYYRGRYNKFIEMYNDLVREYGDTIEVFGYTIRLYRDYIVVPVGLIKKLLGRE